MMDDLQERAELLDALNDLVQKGFLVVEGIDGGEPRYALDPSIAASAQV